ncbi:hypothetical protein GCM10022403_035370 [Streptomyces coacervatus]|uniref:DUF4328 domain-containing protein n=1 Tax=Streptomyces coacervatus TaxID=647381 RepID=A0ABP7HS15_9ACTN|nr:DUF4328 domain-containing protein [Streptomyces coacervatus]MDF2271031.1 DUF4328 domain-containing protein [Streptomyces coacervatus]
MNDHIEPPTAFSASPAPALRPVRAASLVAMVTLALAGAGWVARAVWHIRLAMAGEPASGPPDQGGGNHRTLTSLEDSYHLVGTASGFAALVCGIAFVVWLGRVRDNGGDLAGTRPRYSALWVYFGWIVPIINLWFPRGIVADAYRSSAPGERLPRSLNVWWGLWLIGAFGGVGITGGDSADKVIARAYTHVWQLLAFDAAVVGAAVAGIFVVRAVTAVQQRHLDGDALQYGGSPVS